MFPLLMEEMTKGKMTFNLPASTTQYFSPPQVYSDAHLPILWQNYFSFVLPCCVAALGD